jgi:hypothetical protein
MASGGVCTDIPLRTDSVKRGRFISLTMLAISFSLFLSVIFGFMLQRYADG